MILLVILSFYQSIKTSWKMLSILPGGPAAADNVGIGSRRSSGGYSSGMQTFSQEMSMSSMAMGSAGLGVLRSDDGPLRNTSHEHRFLF